MSLFDSIMGPLLGGNQQKAGSAASPASAGAPAQPQSTGRKILTGVLTTGLGGVTPQRQAMAPAVAPPTLPRPAGPPEIPTYTPTAGGYTPVPQGFNPWQDPLQSMSVPSNLATAANMKDLLGVDLNGYLTGGNTK